MGLLFPLRCAACEKPFQEPPSPGTRAAGGSLETVLCQVCIAGFTPVASPLCRRCGRMFTSPEGDDHLCADCITTAPPFERARAAGVYEGPLRTLIQAFKFSGKTALARPLGALAFHTFLRHWEPGSIDLIMPVPLHARRMRRRGFNQAWLLIRDWPERYRTAQGTSGDITLCRKALIRHRRTPPQTGLDGEHRRRNIRNAFCVTKGAILSGKRILLVDDVYTTGATVGECARVLMAADAGRVDILTLARTMRVADTRRAPPASGEEPLDD